VLRACVLECASSTGRGRPDESAPEMRRRMFDEKLAERIRRLLANRRDVEERRMFGGTAFLLRGHMSCGVVRSELMVRVPAESTARLLREPHARAMDFTGRPMRGFVFVGPDGVGSAAALRKWVGRGLAVAERLPPKSLVAAPRRKRDSVKQAYASVQQYISAQPRSVQTSLRRVRAAIRRGMPGAKEAISYQIPTYRLDNVGVLSFAGWKEHWSLYPASAPMVKAFRKELAGCELSKGTIRFPLDRAVPVKLVERLARFRAREALERAKAKAAARKRRRRAARTANATR
jgi:uncharacterized protein YdhG (YjbR/CyaY superfamily)